MERVTVNLDSASLYVEPDSKFYRIKRKLTYGTILKAVKNYAKKNKSFSILEIGTGSGFCMAFLEHEFPSAEITGLEYDPRLVKLTKKKVINAKIFQGNAEAFSFDKKFDIIISLQVIEHLYHPELMIENVKKHLNKDGIFILTTPNLDCLSARLLKEKWHGFREDHVSLKNVGDWKKTVEAQGFETIYVGSTFFSGIPLLNKLPLGIINWSLLFFIGKLRWKLGESFFGIFRIKI